MWLDLGDYHGPSHFHAFVMYAIARHRKRVVQSACRDYICDTLRMIPQGMYPARTFSELIQPRREIDVSAIIDHVASVIGEPDEST